MTLTNLALLLITLTNVGLVVMLIGFTRASRRLARAIERWTRTREESAKVIRISRAEP